MILIFLLFVKLSILNVCASHSQGYKCTDPTKDEVILIARNNESIHNKLNEKFKDKCDRFYDIIDVPDNVYFDLTRRRAKLYPYVINLFANENVVEGILKEYNLTYAADMNPENTNFTDGKEHNQVAVTSSKLEENNRNLFEFISDMKISEEGEIISRSSCYPGLKTVLICLNAKTNLINRTPKVNIDPLKIILSTDCKEDMDQYNNNFLAILSAKELPEINYEYPVPVVFYDTPYMEPEIQSNFPNSMTIAPWQLLKYGFIEFLKIMNFGRIALVSDDSFYSSDFENELIPLLNKELIPFKKIQCGRKCEESQNTLRKVKARIVIANVNHRNLKYLIRTNSKLTWLIRDMIELEDEDISRTKSAFTFSLEPKKEDDGCVLNDKILAGLNSISLAYRELNADDLNLSRKKIYRKLAVLMRKNMKYKFMALVHILKKDNVKEKVLSMYVDEGGANVIKFKDPYNDKFPKPGDGNFCLARSYTYEEPCADIQILVLMFVIVMFALTVLIITCYFHETSYLHKLLNSRSRRYRNF